MDSIPSAGPVRRDRPLFKGNLRSKMVAFMLNAYHSRYLNDITPYSRITFNGKTTTASYNRLAVLAHHVGFASLKQTALLSQQHQ